MADDVAGVLPVSNDSASGVGTIPICPQFQANSSLQEMVDEAGASFVLQALEPNRLSVRQTAERLRIERTNFYEKLTKYGIKRPDDEPHAE